jgi:hypothetical protein
LRFQMSAMSMLHRKCSGLNAACLKGILVRNGFISHPERIQVVHARRSLGHWAQGTKQEPRLKTKLHALAPTDWLHKKPSFQSSLDVWRKLSTSTAMDPAGSHPSDGPTTEVSAINQPTIAQELSASIFSALGLGSMTIAEAEAALLASGFHPDVIRRRERPPPPPAFPNPPSPFWPRIS